MKYFRISRSVKKPFPFHEMVNFTKWLRQDLKFEKNCYKLKKLTTP
jgi:hypothetical protein